VEGPAALTEGHQENEVGKLQHAASMNLTAPQDDAPNEPGLVPEVNQGLAPENAPVLHQVRLILPRSGGFVV
jgi:hypothetical protein